MISGCSCFSSLACSRWSESLDLVCDSALYGVLLLQLAGLRWVGRGLCWRQGNRYMTCLAWYMVLNMVCWAPHQLSTERALSTAESS